MHFNIHIQSFLTQPKRITFLILFLCLTGGTKSYGQTAAKNYFGRISVTFTKEKRPKKFFAKVEIKSPFPGGDTAWVRSIERNINESISVGRRVKKGTYIVTAKFILSKDGSLADIACENDPGYEMCAAVLRALKKTKKWTPAGQMK
jgi:hypothetical protein